MEKIEEIISRIDSHQRKESTKELKKYLKKWPWFVIFCFITISLSFFKYRNSPTIYEIKSRILVIQENQGLNSVLAFNNQALSMGGATTNIENKIGILKSYTLFRKALINLDWQTSWFKKELLYNKELYQQEPFELILPPNAINAQEVLLEIVPINDKEYKIIAEGETDQNGYHQFIDINERVKFGTPFNNEFFNFTLNKGHGIIDNTYFLKFNNLNSITKRYLRKTDINVEGLGSDMISIVINGNVIQKEADFINELNNVFIQFGMENKNISSDNSLEFIDSQLSRIKTKLQTAEENVSNYRRNKQVINLSQEAQLVYQKLEEVDEEKYLTQLQIDYYRDLQQYLDDSKKISEMVNPSVIGITDANLNGMLSKLMELYSRKEVLSYSVKEKSPTFIMLEKEITITRDGLEETLKNQLKATESILESAEKRYKSMEARIKQLPETEKELIGIQREFDLNNDLYTYLLQKRAEASISKASIAPEVQIIDPAIAEASKRVGPNMIKYIGIGIITGVGLPFVLITLLSFFNNKIESREEIEKSSKIHVFEGIVKHKYKVKLPVVHHPRSGIAESFRGVKSNINAILKQPGSKVISINSLIPGEGKSFISSNLSAIIAKANNKTLLIGADMHKPTLHLYLGVEECDGLSNYLKNEKSIDDIIVPSSLPNLSFIQAGPVPPNPSDLVNNIKFAHLIEKARHLYDYIIIDNAPLMLVPDAILSSDFSDLSIFLLRINHSHKEQITQINKIVDFNKIKRAAIVINDAPDRGYSYGNKYWKKGYGDYKHNISIA